jgi:hypothetical protein
MLFDPNNQLGQSTARLLARLQVGWNWARHGISCGNRF